MNLRYPRPIRKTVSVSGWVLLEPTSNPDFEYAMHSELSPAWIDGFKGMKGWYLGGVRIWEEKI